jgi:hypothetical protein
MKLRILGKPHQWSRQMLRTPLEELEGSAMQVKDGPEPKL